MCSVRGPQFALPVRFHLHQGGFTAYLVGGSHSWRGKNFLPVVRAQAKPARHHYGSSRHPKKAVTGCAYIKRVLIIYLHN
jgi:hypothetical protein